MIRLVMLTGATRRVVRRDEVEEHDDQQQRAEQPVVAQIVFPQLAADFRLEGGGVGLDLRVSLERPCVLAHDRRHDLLLTGFLGGHFVDEPALVHHVDAVADAKKLGHLRGDDDDAFALATRGR